MKKRWLAAALACLLLTAVAGQAGADTFAVVTGTNSLNVRSGPGIGYNWLGNVPGGGWVHIEGIDGNWRNINVVGSTLTGYLSASYLTWVDPAVPATATVRNGSPTQFLNLRQSPSYAAPVLGIYYDGAVCTLLSENGGWYYVSIGGKQGYFRGEYLELSGGAFSTEKAMVRAANGNKVNMRTGPSLGYPMVAQIASGTAVTVLLKGNDFWMITSGGKIGFMASEFLTSSGMADAYAVVKNPVSTQKLNLREQADLGAKVLGQYGNLTRVNVLAQGIRWCKVTVDARTGYMQTGYLLFYGLPGVPVKVTGDTSGGYVNMRAAATQSSAVTGRVPSGTRVTVLTPGDEWTQVRYGSVEGYIVNTLLN